MTAGLFMAGVRRHHRYPLSICISGSMVRGHQMVSDPLFQLLKRIYKENFANQGAQAI